jgi:hypothetical protein
MFKKQDIAIYDTLPENHEFINWVRMSDYGLFNAFIIHNS